MILQRTSKTLIRYLPYVYQHARSFSALAFINPSLVSRPLFGTQSQCNYKLSKPFDNKVKMRYISTGASLRINTSVATDPAFVDMGLGDGWWPTSLIHTILENVHLYTNSPWWLTLIVGTVFVRCITLPIFVESQKQMIKNMAYRDEMTRLTAELNRAKMNKHKNMHHVQYAQMNLQKFYKDKGISPVRSAGLGMFQPILFMTWFRSIRTMCVVPVPSMLTGGTLWFSNLTVPDHSLILPFMCGTIVAMSLSNTIGRTIDNEKIKTAIYCIPILLPILAMTPISSQISSAVYLYVGTNSLMTLLVVQALQNEKIKKYLNIPEVPKSPVIKKSSSSNSIFDMFKDTVENAKAKQSVAVNENAVKDLRKQQADALKKPPPVTYEIGTEAILRSSTLDFQVDTRPPKPNIFKKQS